MNRRLIVVLAIISVVIIMAIVLDSLNKSCYEILPSFDSAYTRSSEAAELLTKTRNDINGPSSYPIRVLRIAGRTATLMVSQPIYVGDLQFAQDWQQVYADHHGGGTVCVHLRAVWKSGSVTQDFPVGPPL